MTERVLHRVKGKPAIVKSLRGLLLRVHRFGRARATTSADRAWTARMIDQLERTLLTAQDSGDAR